MFVYDFSGTVRIVLAKLFTLRSENVFAVFTIELLPIVSTFNHSYCVTFSVAYKELGMRPHPLVKFLRKFRPIWANLNKLGKICVNLVKFDSIWAKIKTCIPKTFDLLRLCTFW